MATMVWILINIFLLHVILARGQATGSLSLRANPTSHVEIYNICSVAPPNQPGGSLKFMRATAWTYNAQGCSFGLTRSLFRFEQLNTLPTCAKITSAQLQLFGSGPDASIPAGAFSYYPGSPYNTYGTNEAMILRITQPWSVTSVTWNTQPQTDAQGPVIPASTSQYNYNPSPIDVTSQVQSMVQTGQSLYGFMLKLKTEQYYRTMTFYSSLATNVAQRPLLNVSYTIPSGCAPCS